MNIECLGFREWDVCLRTRRTFRSDIGYWKAFTFSEPCPHIPLLSIVLYNAVPLKFLHKIRKRYVIYNIRL